MTHRKVRTGEGEPSQTPFSFNSGASLSQKP